MNSFDFIKPQDSIGATLNPQSPVKKSSAVSVVSSGDCSSDKKVLTSDLSGAFLKSYLVPKQVRHSSVSFGASTADKINSAILLGVVSDNPVVKRFDGGYLVDPTTETVIYYGADAKKFLKDVKTFTDDTQIILQSDGKITAESLNGEKYSLDEPGAILLKPYTYLNVTSVEGNPLVITSKAPPGWYDKFSPEGATKQYFDNLVNINKNYYKGYIHNSAFGDSLPELLDNNIVVAKNASSIKFNKDVKNLYVLHQKLEQTSLSEKEKAKIVKLYKQVQNRKIQAQNPGEVDSSSFVGPLNGVYKKLLDSKILTQNKNIPQKAKWSSLYSEEDLRKSLEKKLALSEEDQDKVIDIWKKTTKSGYDITGLVKEAKGIAVYKHSDKINQYNSMPTEWMTNSTTWTEQGAPFVGVSRVVSADSQGARGFNEIRPEEVIHKHQNHDDPFKKQEEIYVVTKGKAAFYTANDNKKEVKILNAGDMMVVPSGFAHGVVAIDDDYEHLCVQTPSAFQYGFQFKNVLEPFSEELVEEAKNKLDSKKE